MHHNFKKYQKGNSGSFSEDYHRALGTSPWIYVKRLLPPFSTPITSLSATSPSSSSSAVVPHLSEGDVSTIFSQFGEVQDVRFVRHPKTGKFLGTAFIQFKDYRSGILAADSMNSNFETGELCVLYPCTPHSEERTPSYGAGGTMNNGGIIVERCEANEVPPLHPSILNGKSNTYSTWLDSCVPSSTSSFWARGP